MKNGSVDDKKLIRQTVSSHQNDKVKHDDGMTTSCRARDTAGGGRVAFSNAHGDVPMSILQPMHTKNTHGNDDTRTTNTTTTTATRKKGRQSSSSKQEGKSPRDTL